MVVFLSYRNMGLIFTTDKLDAIAAYVQIIATYVASYVHWNEHFKHTHLYVRHKSMCDWMWENPA